MRYQLTIASFLLLSSAFVRGNDTFVTLGTGGLIPIKSNQVIMESEDLHISAHRITVRYVFRNSTDKDIEAMVSFPLPDLDGGTVQHEPIELPSEMHVNFVQFVVRSNGQPVSTRMEARAFRDGRDITPRLAAAGLSANVLLKPLNTALMKLPENKRRILEKEELIIPEEFNPPLSGIGTHMWWATWTMHVQYYWTQRFPANSTVELVQTYRPVVGGSYIPVNGDATYSVEPYCGTSGTLQQIAEVKRLHPGKSEDEIALYERRIDYILTTANNWKGPIRHFHLSVSTDSPSDILATCTPGLQRVAPSRYELTQDNFRPATELKLLILQSKNPAEK